MRDHDKSEQVISTLKRTDGVVMSPQMANAIREYERDLELWRVRRRAEWRSFLLCAIFAGPLYLGLYVASAHDGPVNQTAWFTLFALVSFVGATALSIAAIAVSITATNSTRPVRPALLEPIERKSVASGAG